MRWPIDGKITVTTKFGATPDTGVFHKHAGVDIRAIVGTPVYAPITGKVTDSYLGSTGNIVEVTANGQSHRLLHLSGRNVSKAATVKEGQLVGVSGTFGTGPHVHWDVRKDGTAWDHSFSDYINPETLINEGDDMIETDDDAAELVRGIFKREPTQHEIDDLKGRKWHDAIRIYRTSAAGLQLQAQVDDLRAGKTTNATVLKAGLYQVK